MDAPTQYPAYTLPDRATSERTPSGRNAADRAQHLWEQDEEEARMPSFLHTCVCNVWLYTTFPIRWLANTLLSYRYVYALSVHDLGSNATSHAAQSGHSQMVLNRPPHHRTFGLFTTSTAARVALTEVLGLPEYAGRRVRVGFVELGEREPGAVVAGSGGAGVGGGEGDEGIVVVVEKMYVRASGL
ncbi:hypothetical protein LTR85_000004 [Meristemomyces frigidus]|nr:hypothetical protein LTR85_000004 [Meristemomyces frigidus]